MVKFTQNTNRREEAVEALKAFVVANCDLKDGYEVHIAEDNSELKGWRTLAVDLYGYPSAVVEYKEVVPPYAADSKYLNPAIIGPGFLVSEERRREIHLFGKSGRP